MVEKKNYYFFDFNKIIIIWSYFFKEYIYFKNVKYNVNSRKTRKIDLMVYYRSFLRFVFFPDIKIIIFL